MSRYRLVRDVERYPNFIAKAGLTGTMLPEEHGVARLKMDAPLAGAEDWDNCIEWVRADGDHPEADLVEVAQGEVATAICDKWAAKLGYGFHPDTRGADYRPRLTPMEVIAYDHDMMRLFGLDVLDPYLYAIAALEEWAKRQ